MRVVPATLIGILAGVGLLAAACSEGGNSGASTPSDSAPTEAAEATEATSPAPVSPGATEPADDEIVAAVFIFKPASIEVAAGTEVTWRNTDQILHTATAGVPDAPSGEFDGQMEGAGTSFTHVFDEPGTYLFYCSRHPHMRGEVTVR